MYSDEVMELPSKVMAQQEEPAEMQREVEIAKAEVSDTKCALSDVMRQLQISRKQCDSTRTKVQKYHEKLEVTVGDFV